MNKVQIFRNYDMTELERDINKFLSKQFVKRVIDIKHETNVVQDVLGVKLWTTVIIIYEEKL